jgi:hypothetical protein
MTLIIVCLACVKGFARDFFHRLVQEESRRGLKSKPEKGVDVLRLGVLKEMIYTFSWWDRDFWEVWNWVLSLLGCRVAEVCWLKELLGTWGFEGDMKMSLRGIDDATFG